MREIPAWEALAVLVGVVDKVHAEVVSQAQRSYPHLYLTMAPTRRETAKSLGIPADIIEALYPTPPVVCHECGRPMDEPSCSQS